MSYFYKKSLIEIFECSESLQNKSGKTQYFLFICLIGRRSHSRLYAFSTNAIGSPDEVSISVFVHCDAPPAQKLLSPPMPNAKT